MGKIKSGEVLALDKGEQKKIAKQTKKLKKSLTDGKINITERKPKRFDAAQTRGLIYIAHIPHGFFEEQMRNYFRQFGVITNVKVCRSRKNGNSKGYGYVEFLHPEVAKVAAETMNNYLMFKKRIIAEYVPYEKRPKGLFKGKSATTTNNCSVRVRRAKQISINSTLEPKAHLQRSKSRYTNFVKKMQKLENAGIESNVQPTDLPQEINTENHAQNEPSPVTHEPDPYDSEIEVKVPQKRSRKSITPTTSKVSMKKSKSSVKSRLSRKSGSVEAKESDKVLLAKSLDSVKTLLSKKSSSKSTNLVPSVKKVNKATSNPKLRKKRETSEVKVKGISKKVVSKAKNLSPEMLKRIAQELIRKKGHSLLNLVSAPKKRSRKEKKSEN